MFISNMFIIKMKLCLLSSDASQWVVSADPVQVGRWLDNFKTVCQVLQKVFFLHIPYLFSSWMPAFQAADPVDGKLTGRQVADKSPSLQRQLRYLASIQILQTLLKNSMLRQFWILAIQLRDSASSFHWLSSSIFSCSLFVVVVPHR